MNVRPNYAEGKFYSADKNELVEQIEQALKQEYEKIDLNLSNTNIIGGVVPHAGHIYSSPHTVHFFEIVRESKQQFDVVIIVNPNHTGKGLPVSIDKYDYWKTALGISAIDIELAEKMGIPFDTLSQANEHSAEVILPYIQYFMGTDMKILPISFGAQNFANSEILAKIIYKACKELNRKVLFIASSDFNHFAAPQAGKDLDDYALQALLSYDCQEFDKRIHERNISICGFGTIMTLYNFAKEECGHFKIKILRQGHSGEAIPMDEVVDYISILFYTDK